MESYVKELAKDVVLIQHRELIKEYCIQSDVDFFVMKELKLKVQALDAELKNTNELYLQSVVDREFLIAKLQAFKSMTGEGGQFFKMMEEQSRTVGGRLSNLSDSWEQLRVNIGKSQRGIIASLTQFASSFVEKLNMIVSSGNNMEAAFSKFGAKQYSNSENFFNFLNAGGIAKQGLTKSLTGDKGRMEMLYRSLESMYVKPSEKDKLSALTAQEGLLKMRARFSKSFANKEMGVDEYKRGYALISAALESVAGNLKLATENTKGLESTAAKPGNVEAPVSSTEWSGARAQNITINVTKLVETLNIESADVSEGVDKGAALTKKAFLELLNDANQMANQ